MNQIQPKTHLTIHCQTATDILTDILNEDCRVDHLRSADKYMKGLTALYKSVCWTYNYTCTVKMTMSTSLDPLRTSKIFGVIALGKKGRVDQDMTALLAAAKEMFLSDAGWIVDEEEVRYA